MGSEASKTTLETGKATVETVVYLDMSRYSAISRSLELGHRMGARATQVLNRQIVDLVRQATVDATVDFARAFLKGTGDGAILASRLSCNAATVALPTAVRPRTCAPSSIHSKCSFQICRRGLNSFELYVF